MPYDFSARWTSLHRVFILKMLVVGDKITPPLHLGKSVGGYTMIFGGGESTILPIYVHKCKVPSFMLCQIILMSFVLMMKPRVYLLFLIVAAYFFIPLCRIIPCLILSSLPLSQLSGHLLCSLISSPCFPVLYYYSIPCALLCIIILLPPLFLLYQPIRP